MNAKSWGLLLAVMAAAGCNTPNRPDLRQDALLARMSGGGQVIEPKRCDLRVAILARPLHEDVLNNAVWRVADEQAVDPEARRRLEANGLRVGLITGGLPSEVEKILTAPPPNKVDPTQVLLPDGDFTLVHTMNEPVPQVSLLLNSQGSTSGKDYKDARGCIRLTASHDGTTGVSLRFVPEIQHGPVQHTFGAAPNSGPFAPQQFVMKDGQQEESLRELASTLTLQPGQVAVVGCRAERERSLGSFLFTQAEANSDRMLQKVLLVWATRGTPVASSRDSTPPPPPILEPVKPPAPSDRPGPNATSPSPTTSGSPASATRR